MIKGTGPELTAKDRLQAKHGGFGNRAVMVARVALPSLASMLANVAQILISRVRRSFAIAMLPDFGPFVRWNDGVRSFAFNFVIAMAMVIRTIGCMILALFGSSLNHGNRLYPTIHNTSGI